MSLPLNPESYRTSCDRCRLQKLRCVPSFDSDWPSACQRCTRAQVPCVYSRRARSGRRPKKPDNSNEEEALTPSSGLSYPSIGHVDPIADPFGDLPLDGGPTENLRACTADDGLDLPMHVPFPVAAQEDWWSVSSASSQAGPEMAEPADLLDQPMRSGHCFQEYMGEAFNTCSIQKNTPQSSHHTPINTPPSSSPSSSSQTNNLTSLLSATTTYARHLHHYRQKNSTNLLIIQDYPISEAAHLAQWLWKTLLFRHRAERQGKRSGHDEPPTDTPSLLMALSCYISLVSIYDTLRGDLQPVLAALPMVIPSPAELQRGLQVGELPLTSEGTVRVLDAVRALLDALDAVEDGLCIVRDACGL
ncbi:hypothetical protein P168DRAFT_324823 [Aspergillus campestris IBT 28561]|uniref:Zn(2)-C6 fungal-type domain-containing protein n=1 Tax=Aspergillus campestris (strain IBT 28561) TaxID=1392248 RepID=A0A2I1DC08_ASPC2|nr:uncharacterized protein P168DRAFT_324823 [Aspergillus campestris IBT 28561]PKY07409.1 hypothetical protein P168DRAFT_324823 [Aspergillus campestris IBT 28561]